MDVKKLLALGLVLVAVVSTMAVISAESDVTITLDGIKFNIPEGYDAVEQELDAADADDAEDIDGTQVDTETTAEYQNAAGDELELKVGARDNQKIDSISPAGGENKTIAGKEGYLIVDADDDDNDKYSFEYVQDGKLVKITAVSEDIIGQVIA